MVDRHSVHVGRGFSVICSKLKTLKVNIVQQGERPGLYILYKTDKEVYMRYVTAHEKRDHLCNSHFFTPIESSGFGDCNGTFRKTMRCSVVKVHPSTCVPTAKHCAEKNVFDC